MKYPGMTISNGLCVSAWSGVLALVLSRCCWTVWAHMDIQDSNHKSKIGSRTACCLHFPNSIRRALTKCCAHEPVYVRAYDTKNPFRSSFEGPYNAVPFTTQLHSFHPVKYLSTANKNVVHRNMNCNNQLVSKSPNSCAKGLRTQLNNVTKSTHHNETNANSSRDLSELAAVRYIIQLA